MGSFLSKLRVVTLGAANDLLDKAIDMNSPSALRQYVRDLETALDKMRSEAAVQAGQVRTLTREIGDLQHNIDTEKAVVTKILSGTAPNKDTIARAKASAIVNWQNELQAKQTSLEAQQKTSAEIDQAVANLDAKHTQIVAQVRELERIDRDSKSKEQAAAALNSAGRLVSSGAGVSIDDIKGKMNARHDVADEKFARAMGSIQDGMGPGDASHQADVDDLLKSLTPEGELRSA